MERLILIIALIIIAIICLGFAIVTGCLLGQVIDNDMINSNVLTITFAMLLLFSAILLVFLSIKLGECCRRIKEEKKSEIACDQYFLYKNIILHDTNNKLSNEEINSYLKKNNANTKRILNLLKKNSP